MAAGVTASISLDIQAQLVGTADLGTPRAPANLSALLQLVPGTDTTSKADLMFADTRTLAASATENLDLTGVLTQALGSAFNAAEVVAIAIKADPLNTNDVILGGAASNAFVGPFSGTTPAMSTAPGDFNVLTCKRGWPVTAATGDLLKVTNGGGTTPVSYSIIIIGRTVAA
jgi:hypothetical protein